MSADTGRPDTGARRRKQSSQQAAKSRDENVPGLAARKAAAKLLAAVIEAKTPLDGLTDHEHGHPQFRALEPRDRALVRAILATALRHRVTIEKLISARLKTPLPANATALSFLLHVAAAQILFLDIPDSAAVDLAVTHAKSDPRTTRFAALVNAVLRGLSRDKDTALPAALATTDDAPEWFRDRLIAAYGSERAKGILAAHRIEAPIDFTVKSDPEGWAEQLGGILLPTGTVRVEKLAAPVTELPGFADGAWWVQDVAAALPARMLGDVKGLRVADLCAAPGGKTAQLALAGAVVTAVESSRSRIARLRGNLERLGLKAEIVEADIFDYEPSAPFDAILLDAPCSSTGTVRRHPDVPWTKSPEAIDRLAALQTRLLQRAAGWVKPGGCLVFSNCSLDPQEGEALVADFLARNPEFETDPVHSDEIAGAEPWLAAGGALRTTPADLPLGSASLSGMDGFFAARMRRKA